MAGPGSSLTDETAASTTDINRYVSVSGYKLIGAGACYTGYKRNYHSDKTTVKCSQICNENSKCVAFAVSEYKSCYTYFGKRQLLLLQDFEDYQCYKKDVEACSEYKVLDERD